MTRCTLIAIVAILSMLPSATIAGDEPDDTNAVQLKLKHAILHAKINGHQALNGKLAKVEAICASNQCTLKDGTWTILIDDRLSIDLDKDEIIETALLDLETVDEAAYKLGIHIDWVDFQAQLPLTDDHGNDHVGAVLSGRLVASDGETVNWKNLNPQMCWQLQQQTYVLPQLEAELSDNLGSH